MISVLINLAVWVLSIVGYTVYNLYRKNVKLEEMVIERDEVLAKVSDTIKESDRVLKELDKLGAFQSDDEIGFFFGAVKEIQETLNYYTNKK